MKFLKNDGTIEEGRPLEEYTASFFTNLEAYLHKFVCRNSYHSSYDRMHCRDAAELLMVICTTTDKNQWGEMLNKKVNPVAETTEKGDNENSTSV